MFDRLENLLEPKVTEKPVTTRKPSTKAKRTRKPDKTPENTLFGIKEYNSVMEIKEKIDKEIAETKSTLGEYLRQLDDKRAVAEKSKKLRDINRKLSNMLQSKENRARLEQNGIEIVLDATTFRELIALESVVKSLQQQQQRLRDLQKAQEALKPLDQFGDIEGIRYLVLEKEGIPERILLKIL